MKKLLLGVLGFIGIAMVLGLVAEAMMTPEQRSIRDQQDKRAVAKARAEATVRLVLRDPNSAVFGPAYSYKNGTIVCGLVNARNGFGGYTGMRGYIYKDGMIAFQGEHMYVYNDWLPLCTDEPPDPKKSKAKPNRG